ncbi:hypothetical protein [Undibacterium sp. RuTC16W]|uniref:hypothetical protein n=1 Tax=Undibacterium sp. RuTC16W TaxID=3413048 RepID=UPI003BEFBB6D
MIKTVFAVSNVKRDKIKAVFNTESDAEVHACNLMRQDQTEYGQFGACVTPIENCPEDIFNLKLVSCSLSYIPQRNDILSKEQAHKYH